MLLEAYWKCPTCHGNNIAIAMYPWIWIRQLFGVKCQHCGQRFHKGEV